MMDGNEMDINSVLQLCRKNGSSITDKSIRDIQNGLFKFKLVRGLNVYYKLSINKQTKTVVAYSVADKFYFSSSNRNPPRRVLQYDLLEKYVRELNYGSGEFKGIDLDLGFVPLGSKYLSDKTLVGISKCNKDDKFNIELGIKLAISRLEYKVSKILIRKIELFDRYYINTLVKCMAKDIDILNNKSKEWESDIKSTLKKMDKINK